eukprot:EG_transcript_3712
MSAAKRDYYEVLEIDQRATEDEIRKAYKKMSLRWHPDKNIDNKEEADMRFKELQHAYSVLSDPTERQWYDDHKDAILRGVDPTAQDSEEEDAVNIWPYFNTSCFEGFRDGDSKSFWTVYQEAFDLVTEHEGGGPAPPRFGDSKTPWTEVNAFYSYWTGFTTRRRFGNKDKYNPNLAECRGDRRAIVQENKRLRDKAKREYTALVRNLAVFVKKRDRRVLDFLAGKRKAEEEERKARAEQERLREQLFKQQREEYLRQQAEEEDDPEHQEAAEYIDTVLRDTAANRRRRKQQQCDSEDEFVEYHCPCCDKTFKSEQKMAEHERSKKHIQAAKKYMQELAKQKAAQQASDDDEEDEEDEDTEESEKNAKPPPPPVREEAEEDGCVRAADVMDGVNLREGSEEEEDDETEDSDEEDEENEEKGGSTQEETSSSSSESSSSSSSSSGSGSGSDTEGSTAGEKPTAPQQTPQSEEESSDDVRETMQWQGRRQKKKKGKNRQLADDSDDDSDGRSGSRGVTSQPVEAPKSAHAKKKAKQREYEERKRQLQREEEERKAREQEAAARKAAAKPKPKPKPKPKAPAPAPAEDSTEKPGHAEAAAGGEAVGESASAAPARDVQNGKGEPSSSDEGGEARDYQFYEKKKREMQFKAEAMAAMTCSVCRQCFESRSKLFRHIEDSGHAALKADPGRRGKRR